MAEGGRVRGQKPAGRAYGAHDPISFSNPYPWMSAIEAMVHLALEAHKVPFSWRYFDGDAPTFTQLLVNTGYQPEFTLREYRTVVIVTSDFWGTLPGVLDKTALAQVTLESDGWRVVNLFDSEIRSKGAWELLAAAIPNLGTITGPPRPNPYGRPDLLAGIRNRVVHRVVNPTLKEAGGKRERRRVRRGSRSGSDGGRRRIGQSGSLSGKFKAR